MASTTNDKRLTAIEKEETTALKESDALYNGMINSTDSAYQRLIDNANQYGDKQIRLQEEQNKLNLQEIEQNKKDAYDDFQKESSAAYVEWQKQTDDYGSNAEKMASMGLAHSGYSEQSKVAMYNQYQNRVALARETYKKIEMNYNLSMDKARLQNSSVLAEITYNTMKTALELGIQGLQEKNELLLQKVNTKRQISDSYWGRYTDTLNQINTENALAEQQRQYNLNRQLELQKYNESVRQFNANLAEEKRQFNETMAYNKKKNSVSSSSSGGTGNNNKKQGNDNEKKGDTKKVSANAKKIALSKVKNVKTYANAQTLLKTYGISKTSVPMLNSAAWNKAKRTGQLGSEFEGINSYKAYLDMYCKWAINEYL